MMYHVDNLKRIAQGEFAPKVVEYAGSTYLVASGPTGVIVTNRDNGAAFYLAVDLHDGTHAVYEEVGDAIDVITNEWFLNHILKSFNVGTLLHAYDALIRKARDIVEHEEV